MGQQRGKLSSHAIGAAGEALAARFLESRGYVILDRNVRTRYGELDLIARDGETLVFVEVRARSSSAYGSALESVNGRKQSRLAALAEAYMQRMDEPPSDCRIDVVAIQMGYGGRVEKIELVRNAV